MKKLYNFLKVKLCYRTYWKQWLALLAICFLIFACSGGNDKNTLTELNLKGKVKSVYITSFEAIEKSGEVTRGDKKWKNEWEFDDRSIYVVNGIDEKFYSKYKLNYDDNGNRIEGKQYNSDGILDYIVKFKYDINGNLIEQNQYNKKGELDYKVKIKYDINGYIIEENQYNSEGDILIEGIPSMYDYVELRYEYEFDDKENWIQKTIFEDDKPTFILEREIEYYD